MATLNDSSVLLAGENVLDSIFMPAMAIFGSFFSCEQEMAKKEIKATKTIFLIT